MTALAPPRLRRSRRRSGITLVEVMIALGVIMIALLGLLSAISYTTRQNALTREREAAHRAAELKLEEVRAEPFDNIFTRYAHSGADRNADNKFWVEGIDPPHLRPGPGVAATQTQIDQWSGWVLFPGDAPTLSEATADSDLGMPRDLNANGAIDAAPFTNGYTLLPFKIRVKWKTVSGEFERDYPQLLLKK